MTSSDNRGPDEIGESMRQSPPSPAAPQGAATAGVGRLLAVMDDPRANRVATLVFVLAFLALDVVLLFAVMANQPLGVDFMPLWTGARIDPARLYDFAFVTDQQTWIRASAPRPFVYPPSALLLFKPLALLPFWPAYATLIAGTGALFAWAGARLGADWRLLMLPLAVVLVALAGQVTFLIAGLVTAALALRDRPLLCGVLFGLAGAVKPQMLVLLPLALMIEGNWRAFWATGATAAACGAVSLLFGASWSEWLAALPRFSALIAENPSLLAATLSPYARWGAGSYLFTLPLALAALWFAFRSGGPPQRVLALLGGALLLSPYAMNYEIALLVPAVLALRKPLLWSAPFWVALACVPNGPTALLLAMALLFVSMAPQIIETGRRLRRQGRGPREA